MPDFTIIPSRALSVPLLTLSLLTAVGQDPEIQRLSALNRKIDSLTGVARMEIREDSIDQRYLSRNAYDRFFDKYFTLINYERESFTDGNSAALKLSDKDTRLDLTLSTKSSNAILSVTTGLNVKDASGNVFSGQQPTTGTRFGINGSFLLRSKRLLSFFDDQRSEIYSTRREIIDSLKTAHTLRDSNKLLVLKLDIKRLDNLIDNARSKLNDPTHQNEDTIRKYRQILVSSMENRQKLLTEKENLLPDNAEKAAQKIWKATEKRMVEKQLAAEGMTSLRMIWISLGGAYRKDTYATFDKNQLLAKAVGETPFDGYTMTIAPNFFWQRTQAYIDWRKTKFNAFYASVLYTMARSNSFADLTESTLTVLTATQSNDTTFQFASTKKLRDITGKEFSAFYKHRIGVQVTGMLGKKQFWGLNAGYNVESAKNMDPSHNLRLGTLFRFIDSADQKSKVNIELFVSLRDLSNVGKSDLSPWERKEIGITTSVPLKMVFFR